MRSKTLWLTDLGLTQVGSGELSPGLDPIELRFYPTYGLSIDEWEFEVGTIKGIKPASLVDKDFDEESQCFKLRLQFGEMQDGITIQIYAKHNRTDFKKIVWEGDILPNMIHLTSKVVGLSQRNWDVITEFKKTYPNAILTHFKLPTIEVLVPSDSLLVASAKSELEHTEENAPITFKGFHKEQEFQLNVNGFVIGYGGKGGDAGISTILENDVQIEYPTDGLDGGNTVFIEHQTQKVHVNVSRFGCFLPGQGGKGASAFSINSPANRLHQIGHAGMGGYPNGLNGQVTEIHYKLGLIEKSCGPTIKVFGRGRESYSFEEGVFLGHPLPYFTSNNSCIRQTNDGKSGQVAPKGVVQLNNQRTLPIVKQVVYAYGTYVEI